MFIYISTLTLRLCCVLVVTSKFHTHFVINEITCTEDSQCNEII